MCTAGRTVHGVRMYRCFLLRKRLLRHRAVADMSSYALLFPGQGSQYVGMTCKHREYPKTKEIFQTANSVLGYDLESVCLNGPQQLLNETVHCQPAVVVASLVALQQLEKDSPQVLSNCVATAGFSVGEITALIYAGAFSLEEGLRLIKTRAESMHSACQETNGSMLSLANIDLDAVQHMCDLANKTISPSPQVCLANLMFPRGVVVSGGLEGVQFVGDMAADKGAVVKQVAVSGAFHSNLMASAVPKLSQLLSTMDIALPRYRVYSNVTGRPYTSADEIRQKLAQQVTQPVLWEASIRNMLADGPLTFVDVGPSKQLKAMLKRIDRDSFKSCITTEYSVSL